MSPSSDFDTSLSATESPASASISRYATPMGGEPLAEKSTISANYLGIGCLCYPDVLRSSVSVLEHDLGWTEITSPMLKLHPDTLNILPDQVQKLIHAGWVRVEMIGRGSISPDTDVLILRVYVLFEDVGNRSVDRSGRGLRSSFARIVANLDISPETWKGQHRGPESGKKFDPWCTAQEGSLFYLFNKLHSPEPAPDEITDSYSRKAAMEVLDGAASPLGDTAPRGLKTRLYPYQARSAALMIQREAAPQLIIDPTVERRQSPTGKIYYYRARESKIFQYPTLYESNRGGILAETMGLGKTVICLAVILATRYHPPKIPSQYQSPVPVRERTGSLMEMAAATTTRHSIPWRSFIESCEESQEIELDMCRKALESAAASYTIPSAPSRNYRSSVIPPPRQLSMCYGTIIVVPRNLLHQWQSEIKKHVLDNLLRVLTVDGTVSLPPVEELTEFDIVLFSRSRFEKEVKHGSDTLGRRGLEDSIYQSPLLRLHWLRIIIDEGHNFSSSKSNAVRVAGLVQAERRWVVSGTPAKDLVGVELDLSTNEAVADEADQKTLREAALELRKDFNRQEDASGAAKGLGLLISHFLQVRPWANSSVEGKTEWDDHIYRHEHHFQKTYTSFATCLSRTMEGLVVKTRPEDVERDIKLPPMTHKVIFLEPSYYDKLVVNMFIHVLRSNAITSERKDRDYLWHKDSQKSRHSLIKNLRQSSFAWTGFSEDDVAKSIENAERYLSKEGITCSDEDRYLLQQSTEAISGIIESEGWLALSRTHELGLFVQGWPIESMEAWSLCPNNPMIIGISQLIHANDFVESRPHSDALYSDLKEAGHESNLKLYEAAQEENERRGGTGTAKTGVPVSCMEAEPKAAGKLVTPNTAKRSPQKKKYGQNPSASEPVESRPKSSRKRKPSLQKYSLPPDSQLRQVSVIGTTSSKLSYLMDKVLKHYTGEKILIFYDGDNTAYYIAQALEVFHIEHRIYAKTLDNATKSQYVVSFSEDPALRVLLIDVACGALGLNLNAASLVLIVNPINRPSIEAQVIKRAHRIGQTRPVSVETLVLKGTIEEAIFQRAKAMTRNEHLEAKNLEDDGKIASIIQNAQILPLTVTERAGPQQAHMAALAQSHAVFGTRPMAQKQEEEGPNHPNLLDRQAHRQTGELQSNGAPRPPPATKRVKQAEGGIGSLAAVDLPMLGRPIANSSSSSGAPSFLSPLPPLPPPPPPPVSGSYPSIFGGGQQPLASWTHSNSQV